MADAQYMFITYSCKLYYEKACRLVVVVHATGSKVHEFESCVFIMVHL